MVPGDGDRTSVPFDDDLLLALLEMAIGDHDPVPAGVVASARDVFELRFLERCRPPDRY